MSGFLARRLVFIGEMGLARVVDPDLDLRRPENSDEQHDGDRQDAEPRDTFHAAVIGRTPGPP